MSKRDRAEKKRARVAAEKTRKEAVEIIKRINKEKEPIAGKPNRFREKSYSVNY